MADDSSEIVKEGSEAASFANVKSYGDAPAFLNNLAMQQALDAAQGWRTINQAIVGKIAESIIATQPSEGGVDVAALQALAKLAQTTPPVTG